MASSISEVYVEQGSIMGRRRRRRSVAPVRGHVSANHDEQVLMRRLLTLQNDKDDELRQPQAQEDSSLNHYPQGVSFFVVMLVAMVVIAMVIMGVVLWVRRRYETTLPASA